MHKMAISREAFSECECLLSHSTPPVPVELPSNLMDMSVGLRVQYW